VFRRRRQGESDEDTAVDDVAVDETDDETATSDPDLPSSTSAPGRPEGPWDAEDAPEDSAPRIDLGAVQVPVGDGMEVRVDVQDEMVVAATLVDGHSMLQIHAFAAPRSSGLWDDVRDEIAGSLRDSGGEAQHDDGPFGAELRARIPVEAPGQGPTLQPARFLGVDGPRWFLRGMLTGPAATDPVQAKRLEEVFRGTIVVRGGEAMAPRELLPLRLPREAVEQPPAAPSRPELEVFQRGPEITEIQ
jgi:hypothetical protein